MPAYGKTDYLRVLKKVQSSEHHQVDYYSSSDHNVATPDDEPLHNFFDWSRVDRLVIDAAVEKGFLALTRETDWEDRDWRMARISLTAMGNDYANQLSEPLWSRWLKNLAVNIPTIITSVITALGIAWLLRLLGMEQ